MENLIINREAQRLARELLKQTKENELEITTDLQNIASQVSAEMVGLENKFKTEMSLIRKLIEAVGDDLQRLQRKSKNINDVLCYTFILPFDDYAKGFRQTIERLRNFWTKTAICNAPRPSSSTRATPMPRFRWCKKYANQGEVVNTSPFRCSI